MTTPPWCMEKVMVYYIINVGHLRCCIQMEFMALSGTLSLAYFIHNCVITIMKGNRHQEKNVAIHVDD